MRTALVLSCLLLASISSAFGDGSQIFAYSFGRPLQTAPAVDNDQTIYIGGKGAIAAVSPAGTEKWKVELSTGSQSDIGTISLDANAVYVTSSEGVFAFSKRGTKLWSQNIGSLDSALSISATGDLFVGDNQTKIHAIRNGAMLWSKFQQTESVTTPPWAVKQISIGIDGLLYAPVSLREVFILDQTGTKQGAVSVPAMALTPILFEDGSLVVPTSSAQFSFLENFGPSHSLINEIFVNGFISMPVAGPDKTIYAMTSVALTPSAMPLGLIGLDLAGNTKLAFKVAGTASPAVGSDGTIYAAGRTFAALPPAPGSGGWGYTSGPLVVAVKPDGTLAWSYTASAEAAQGLTLAGGNTLYVAHTDGTLRALTTSSGVATRGWPVYGRDSKHTFQQRGATMLNTLSVSNITDTAATFAAEINTAGAPSSLYFEYSNGLSSAKSSTVSIPASSTTSQFSISVTGLSPGTQYSVRAFSSNALEVISGNEVFFRTADVSAGDPPVLQTLQAAASLGGTVKFSGDGVIEVSPTLTFTKNAVIDANGHSVVLVGKLGTIVKVNRGIQLTFKGITFIKGTNIAIASSPALAGAIINDRGDLTVINCVFSQNQAIGLNGANNLSGAATGGAISQLGGKLTVENSEFSNNSVAAGRFATASDISYARGGAIYLSQADAQINNTRFLSNSSSAGGGANFITAGLSGGAAIYSDNSTLKISSSTFTGNGSWGGGGSSETSGGAIWSSGSIEISNSSFGSNLVSGGSVAVRTSIQGAPALGGAVSIQGTGLVSASAFIKNEAHGGTSQFNPGGVSHGGALYVSGNVAVINSTFSANSAGSIASYGQPGATIANPGLGSAVFAQSAAGITNCTVVSNTQASSAIDAASPATLSIKSTILSHNESANAGTNVIDLGNNLSSDATPAFTQASSKNNIDAKLGPLGNYGGTTPVYPLLSGSAAIDAADDSAAPATDQRGRTRPYGVHADIGAFESSSPFAIWGKINGYIDPTTKLTVGQNETQPESDGSFSLTLPAGSSSIVFSSQNSIFRPNPWNVTVSADGDIGGVTSFKIHSFVYDGAPGNVAFTIVGLAGEKYAIDSSADLQSWTTIGTFTIEANGLATVSIPSNPQKIFLRARPQ